jgi:hypothetical protein
MKTLIIASGLLLLSTAAHAENPLFMDRNTIENDRARHSAERYEEYKQNNYQAPLGGYTEKFGDSATAGTISPGYATSPRLYNPTSNSYKNDLITSSPNGRGY